ncbi:DciA family protein [Streptomyces netropsis]|uniref:DciA family protein n=1 Tax=Streptomyces netropsis TaxID=55404 RepID=UPI0037B6F716
MSGGEMSGVDLARVALRAAGEAVRKNGGGQKARSKPSPVRTVRRDGREPMGLGVAIGALVTERAWELPAAGATLRERWAAIAPGLAGHVAAVAFDPDFGQLIVCPESTAWATKARLGQARVIEAANISAGRTVVRALRVLAPGSVPAPVPEPADVAPAAPTGPVRTKETASAGCQEALAARQASRKGKAVGSEIQAAAERQAREQAREPEGTRKSDKIVIKVAEYRPECT